LAAPSAFRPLDKADYRGNGATAFSSFGLGPIRNNSVRTVFLDLPGRQPAPAPTGLRVQKAGQWGLYLEKLGFLPRNGLGQIGPFLGERPVVAGRRVGVENRGRLNSFYR